MIAVLFAAAALAEPADCEDPRPIGGTAGFEAARDALSTTIETYSASTAAERRLFLARTEDAEGAQTLALYEMHQTFGAARVPVWFDRTNGNGSCPEDWSMGVLPLDVGSILLGAAFRGEYAGVFYAASASWGWMSQAATYDRVFVNGLGLPMYASGAMLVAPLTGGGFVTESGSQALALDWIAGADVNLIVADLHAGYAGSRGFYGNVAERRVGLFASSILRGTKNPVDAFKAGIDRFTAADLAPNAGRGVKRIGQTTAFGRDLPFVEAIQGDGQTFTRRLRSVHLSQENIGGVLDLVGAYTFAPEPGLQHAAIGLHTPWAIAGRSGTDPDATAIEVTARGGVSQLPARWALGIPEETRPYWAVWAGSHQVTPETGKDLTASIGLHMNDPDQMALYPSARQALTLDVRMAGAF